MDIKKGDRYRFNHNDEEYEVTKVENNGVRLRNVSNRRLVVYVPFKTLARLYTKI